MLFLVAGPAVSSVVIPNDPGTSYLPAALSAIPVESLGGLSVGAGAELVISSAPVTIVSPVDSGANLLRVSAEGGIWNPFGQRPCGIIFRGNG